MPSGSPWRIPATAGTLYAWAAGLFGDGGVAGILGVVLLLLNPAVFTAAGGAGALGIASEAGGV